MMAILHSTLPRNRGVFGAHNMTSTRRFYSFKNCSIARQDIKFGNAVVFNRIVQQLCLEKYSAASSLSSAKLSLRTVICVHLLSIRTSQLNQSNQIVLLFAHAPAYRWTSPFEGIG